MVRLRDRLRASAVDFETPVRGWRWTVDRRL